jgi:hypothetical protein
MRQREEAVIDFATTNNTSIECATAVFERAKSTGRSVIQIWKDPTEDDTIFVIQRAFSLLPIETRRRTLGRANL